MLCKGTVIYIFVLISFSCYGDFIVLISFSCRPPAMAAGSMVIQGNEYHGARDGTVMHLKRYACMGSMNHVVLPCAGHAVNPGSITPCSGLFRWFEGVQQRLSEQSLELPLCWELCGLL